MNFDRFIGNSRMFDSAALIGGGDDPIPEKKIKITDSAGLKTGDYSHAHISKLTKAAKAAGVDPYDLISLTLQESGIGTAEIKAKSTKPGAAYRMAKQKQLGLAKSPNFLGQINDFSEAQQKELDELSTKSGIEPYYLKPALALREKLSYAKKLGFKDPALMLQAYNGYGTLTKESVGADKAYGVPIGAGIDMKKNPLYGKRLLALKSDLQKNKEIMDIINSK